jgi:predicted Zn-dependent peptidase
LLKNGINKEELRNSINYIIGRKALAYERTESIFLELLGYEIFDKLLDFQIFEEILKQYSEDDILKIIKKYFKNYLFILLD